MFKTSNRYSLTRRHFQSRGVLDRLTLSKVPKSEVRDHRPVVKVDGTLPELTLETSGETMRLLVGSKRPTVSLPRSFVRLA